MNTDEYWIERGKTYRQEFRHTDAHRTQERALIEALSELRFKSVFEAGCGFGRITSLVAQSFRFQIDRYDAVDISPHQLHHAIGNVVGVNFVLGSVEMAKSRYDLALAVEFLMHIPPERIAATMHKLLSIGTVLVHADYYEEQPPELAPHNFNHDYPAIYKELGARVFNFRKIGRQAIWTCGY